MFPRQRHAWLAGFVGVWLFTLPIAEGEQPAREARPNIVLIMVDDMGWSDLGCYGGEINTPHLDRLAADGVRFTQAYNCAKCETTRATLLSGRYAPEVGIGQLRDSVTLAEVLSEAGYTTLMTGKWHLAGNPVDRGFGRYFGHLSGATNFFTGDDTFRLDREVFEVPEEGFYTTDAFTDYAIQFVREADAERPFFLYLAYNAPHYPLQAPEAEVAKYRGKYRGGWDRLRAARHRRITELGLLGTAPPPLPPRPDDVPAWEELTPEQQEVEDLVMATYAAMIDSVDQNVGRLVEALQAEGRFENTLVLFLSDNGACPFQRTRPQTLQEMRMPWRADSYWTYDKGWAHACNTPFRGYKQNQHEGGICTPLIAHWPAGIEPAGTLSDEPVHLVDIMATCQDLGRAEYPSQYQGRSVGPARGRSLGPVLRGVPRSPHPQLYFTFYGKNNALRVGDWKLVNKDFGPWELYNLAEDRNELDNLAAKHSASSGVLQRLQQHFERLAEQIGTGRGKKDSSASDSR